MCILHFNISYKVESNTLHKGGVDRHTLHAFNKLFMA